MKKTIQFFALVVLVLSGCGKDDPKPLGSITVVEGPEGVHRGVVSSPTTGVVSLELAVKSPEGFSALEIFKVIAGEEIPVETLSAEQLDLESDTDFLLPYNYLLTKTDVGVKATIKAAIIDKKQRKGKATTLVEVEGKGPMTPANYSLQLNNPIDGNIDLKYYVGMSGSMLYSMSRKEITAQNSYSDVIMALSINNALGVYLSSPKPNVLLEEALLQTFTVHRSTQFKKVPMTADQYNKITSYSTWETEDLYHNGNFGPHEERVSGVKVGDALVFKTFEGTYGIMRLDSYTSANGVGSYTVKGWMSSGTNLLN
jgi:hypothetical protein